MHSRILSCFLFVGLICFSAFSARGQTITAARAPGQIVVAAVTGSVFSIRDGVSSKLSKGGAITMGDVIETAESSTVLLAFSNGSTITLGAKSRLEITKYLQTPLSKQIALASMTEEPEGTTSETELDLKRGELIGNVKTLNKNAADPSSYTVRTPVGAAGIRGTIFRVVYRPTSDGKAFFSVTTSEGRVEVFSGVISTPAFVGMSEEIEISVDIDPTTGALLSPPVIVTPTAASTATLTEISAIVSSTVASLQEIIISSGSTAAPSGTTEEEPTSTPGATQPNNDTTPGDGKTT